MNQQRQHWLTVHGPWILTVMLCTLMTTAVVQSVARSNWATGLGVMVPIALGAIAIGTLFARLRWLPGFLAHILSSVLGIAWTVSRLGPQMDEGLSTWRDQATELLIRGIILVRLVSRGGVGDDLLLFVAVLGLLSWALAYASVWMLARHGWSWPVVLLNAGILFINLTYASPKPPISLFFLFLGAAMLVIVQQTYLQRARTWDATQMEYPDLLGWRFVFSGSAMVLVLLLGTTLLPTRITAAKAAQVWLRVREPWQQVQARWDRTFSTINAPANAAGGGFGGRSFRLTGSRTLGDALVMEVQTSRYDYWRAVAYDRYDGRLTWPNTTGELARATLGRASADDALTPLNGTSPMPLLDTTGRRIVTQTYHLRQSFSVPTLFAATQPVSVSLPALVEHTYLSANGTTVANFTDMSMLQAQQPLRSGASYTVQSLVSDVDKASLRAASTAYPEWVDRYLQLPQTLPQRLRDRAHEIVTQAGATNAYDKAEAIQSFLRTFPYDEKIPSPPDDRDVVDYFVFDLQRGYCDYFASAMVILLRAEGVPARIAQGYAGGDFDAETGRYVVRQNLAHTWPEVYFPDYGWQRFEPTPASYTRPPQRVEDAQSASGEADELQADRLSNLDLQEQDLLEIERQRERERGAPLTPEETEAAIKERLTREAALSRRTWQQRGIASFGTLMVLLLTWRVLRRPSIPGPAAQVYSRLLRWADWAGIKARPSATPHEVVARLSRHLPQQQGTLEAVATAFTREQYAPQAPAQPSADLEHAWRSLRLPLLAAIFGRFGRSERKDHSRGRE